jgi:hypothetical protein
MVMPGKTEEKSGADIVPILYQRKEAPKRINSQLSAGLFGEDRDARGWGKHLYFAAVPLSMSEICCRAGRMTALWTIYYLLQGANGHVFSIFHWVDRG